MMGLDRKRLVFIDETGVRTNMVRLYGRSLRGRRLVGRAPHGHWKTTTFISALRHDGLAAPMVVDGAVNSAVFIAYVRYVLLPTLRPDEIVIMDNLSSHKAAGVREVIESGGAQLVYLPPYSPDYNPIEQAYSKLKWLVRSAAERTVEGLWRLLGRLLDRYTPTECQNYITHCGYGVTPP